MVAAGRELHPLHPQRLRARALLLFGASTVAMLVIARWDLNPLHSRPVLPGKARLRLGS